ncbi:MFS transporter [Nocardia terpenica]|uniref:MFS transporter n=1 Tax=Nocardia terpenica TaxID=455432 RepID=A0A291RU59_9NOCA|nr:MFS transporter [Nocardia terpenica]ATL70847.1 MFS transporter [Nocardia terpenica]
MRKWLSLLTIGLGTFMLLVDVTIVNVALPDMRHSLGASFGALQWVIDGYALAMAALLLGAGSIADRAGHRRTYLVSIGLFVGASLLCGLAPTPTVLVAARIVQGVGAAAMSCTTFALLNDSYAGRDRAVAYGLWGAVAGASSAIGPVVGGLLTEVASWRWIFFVNGPIGMAAMALCVAVLPAGRIGRGGRIDAPGMLAFSAFAGTLTYALIRANERDWSDPVVGATLSAAAALLLIFLVRERFSAEPMLDLALLRERGFAGVLIAAICLHFAAFAALMYTQIWMQSVLGMSPIGAGLVGLPLSATAFLVSGTVGRRLHGAPLDRVLGGGLIVIGAGGVLGALLLSGESAWWALLPGFVVVGAGVGLTTATLGSAAVATVSPERAGMATGAVNTVQQLGYALGIAALGGVFTRGAQGSPSGHGLPTAAGVQLTLAISGVAGLLGGAVVFLMLRRGRETPAPDEQVGASAPMTHRLSPDGSFRPRRPARY